MRSRNVSLHQRNHADVFAEVMLRCSRGGISTHRQRSVHVSSMFVVISSRASNLQVSCVQRGHPRNYSNESTAITRVKSISAHRSMPLRRMKWPDYVHLTAHRITHCCLTVRPKWKTSAKHKRVFTAI